MNKTVGKSFLSKLRSVKENWVSLNGKSSPVQRSSVVFCWVSAQSSPEQSQFKSLWWFRQQQLCSVSEPSGYSEHWPSLQLSSRRRNIEKILTIIDIKWWTSDKMVFNNITDIISGYFVLILHNLQLRVILGGWKEKYSRGESFSSLLNLILIYSLMMIQRIAAGLCFIFYIFQNVVGPERSWRRSSQILYHRREEGGRKSYRRVEWSGVTLSYARGQLGKTRVRLLLYNMPSHHQHEWNTRLNLNIWNDAVYFCLTELSGLGWAEMDSSLWSEQWTSNKVKI